MPCEGSTDAPSRPPARVAGRSEAESLDGVEASPKMFDVMACRLTAANSRNLSASMSECHGDGGPNWGFTFADGIEAAERPWDARPMDACARTATVSDTYMNAIRDQVFEHRSQACAGSELKWNLRTVMERRFDRITQNPAVLAGRATIRGLRISVAHVVNLVANGMTPGQIVAELPDLEEEDVREALAYSAALAQDEVHSIRS